MQAVDTFGGPVNARMFPSWHETKYNHASQQAVGLGHKQ